MAGGRQRRQRRRKRRQSAAPPHIFSLDDDLVLEIFLRLPSLATLVRAALTCRAWCRAVASSPSFRRRSRALHRAPLLGLFAKPQGRALPLFAPAHCRDRDVLAAVRGGDFFLTSLQELDCNVPLGWFIDGCRDGYVLTNCDAGLLAAVNPLDRQSPEYIDVPIEDITAGHRGHFDVHLLYSDEDPMSFRLVWLFIEESRVRAAVFSSETWDWRTLPWFGVTSTTPPHDGDKLNSWLQAGTQGNRHIYWLFKNLEQMLTLDTERMELAVSKLPACLKNVYADEAIVGETKDGTPCVVYNSFEHYIGVLLREVDDDGLERWVLDDMVDYEVEYDQLGICRGRMEVVAMEDGFVYLTKSEMIMSLCLETMELETLFPSSFSSFHPYLMAWPPSLVGNYGKFAEVQGDPSNA